MNSFKMERFLPNECYICKSRDNLIRCRCKMIWYCSKDHRLEHLAVHKSFCKVIKELLIEKKVSHIHEELKSLGGSAWRTKREKISIEVTNKLGRPMSLLENAMWTHSRVCFVCRKTRQKDLTNCPDCPMASFCKEHPQNELHTMNCKVMNQYLKVLKTAEELNIDLKFLSPIFPCITEEIVNQVIDRLTLTYCVSDMKEVCLKSRLLKMDLVNFMDAASKIYSVLQKVHDTIPEELLIHIDALSYEHAITEKNYWEFLLHLNPQIKKLKIVITQTENRNNSKKSLCKNCQLEERELIVEYLSKSYDDYMQDKNYQEPDILFYLKIVDECNSEKRNQWSEFNCPVILRFDTNSIFCKTLQFLSLSIAKFEFIYEGQIKAPFSKLSSIENEDYFIILQSKENKIFEKSSDSLTGEICEETIGTKTTENLSEVKNTVMKTHQCGENSANRVEDASKINPSESKDNSDNNENSKLETNENQSASTSYTDSNKIKVIEKENTSTNEIKSAKSSNCQQTENKETNKEEKSEDRVTLSPSSSVRSFVIISGPGEGEEEKNAKNSETEENGKYLKYVDNEFLDPSGKGPKNTKEDNMEKKNIEERKEKENDKKILLNSQSFENNEIDNSSQSYVIGHVSYLENENEGLRQQLNLSFKEITKLQTKFNQVCFELNKKEKVIKNLLRVFVNFEDTDSVCEENKF
ncbi:uncharacterized protein LOC122508668 [Leptopilina heterotoma]|uniref:uncharacterized protein LOC122508668 n=1 Tax=Leptopilina heterotoma TaxID=63436 RepID=UPI001CAA3E65|nr:uncharacterized protein LOC122508668 [Leptopilina heterotoma]